MFKEGNELNTLLVCVCVLAITGILYACVELQLQSQAIKAGLVQTVEQGRIVWTKK